MQNLSNKEGQNVPSVSWNMRIDNEWTTLHSDDVFNNKTVILFSLPGAFTPTCSGTHLPRYNELAGVFKDNGVDDIYCLSVNDTFVMNAWAEKQHAEHVRMLADGNGEFTQAMGMLVDKPELGFGKRSWRYSMLVKNGMIEKMFIEPQKPGDPFEVSDAETMLNYINPQASLPKDITVFSKTGCPFCHQAKQALQHAGLEYEELIVGQDTTLRALRAITGNAQVPQIFIDAKHIGGSDDLQQYLAGEK